MQRDLFIKTLRITKNMKSDLVTFEILYVILEILRKQHFKTK